MPTEHQLDRDQPSPYGTTSSSEMTTGFPAVTPLGVGMPGAAEKLPSIIPPIPPIPPPQSLQPMAAGWQAGWQAAPWPQTRPGMAAAGGAAPGGTNPGGRWPKHRSYFQTSSAINRSVKDLQPLALATTTSTAATMIRPIHPRASIATSPQQGNPGLAHENGPRFGGWPGDSQQTLPHASCAGVGSGEKNAAAGAKIYGSCGQGTAEAQPAACMRRPLLLAVADLGPHSPLLLAEFAAALAGLLHTHRCTPKEGRLPHESCRPCAVVRWKAPDFKRTRQRPDT